MFSQEGIAAQYTPYPLQNIDEVTTLLDRLDGFNVTYPYKESIIPYLHSIDDVAQTIGAVNVVSHGKGYNSDWLGFRDSIRPLLSANDTRALLLGTGGVSKAIQYALHHLHIDFTLVSRNARTGCIRYEDINQDILANHTIIINCTPLGMEPLENSLPALPYEYLTANHLLYDCIYNPEKTLFLQEGERHGCRIKNGLEMLHLQANEAWRIWSNK
jgi:shikimate dehydrogenase